jgi:hypothetical protein
MESESDSEAQDVLDVSKQFVLFAEYDDKAVTPAQQVKKGKLKGAGGGTASYPPVEGMVLDDKLSEAEGLTAACVTSAYLEPSYDLKSVAPETVQTIKRSEPRTVEAWSRILEGVCANPGMTRDELTSMMSMVSRPVSIVPFWFAGRQSALSGDRNSWLA